MLHYAASQIKYDNTAPWSAMSPWDILTEILQRTTDLETISRTVIGAGNKFTGLRYLTSGVGQLSSAVDTAEQEASQIGGNSNSSRPNNNQITQFEVILSNLYKDILTKSVTSSTTAAVDDELQQAIINSIDFGNVDIATLLNKCAEMQKQLQVLAWAQTKLEINPIQGFLKENPTSAIEKQLKMMIDTCLLQQNSSSISILINNINNVYANVANWHFVDIIREINHFYKSFKSVIENELQTPKFNASKKVAAQDSKPLASPAMDNQSNATELEHCRSFARGNCKNTNCPRAHDVRKRKNNDGRQRNYPPSKRSNNSSINVPCRDFSNGGCTRGTNCRYSHQPQSNNRQRNNAPCWGFAKGNCTFGNNCRFSHNQTNQQNQHSFVPKYGPANAAVNAVTQANMQALVENVMSRINASQQPQMAAIAAVNNAPNVAPNVQQLAYSGNDAGQQQQQQQQPQQAGPGQ